MTVWGDAWAFIKDQREWKQISESVRKIPELEARIAALENGIAGPASKYVCAHCASPKLKRVGSRDHAMLGPVGVKEAIFNCEDCQGQTFITIE